MKLFSFLLLLQASSILAGKVQDQLKECEDREQAWIAEKEQLEGKIAQTVNELQASAADKEALQKRLGEAEANNSCQDLTEKVAQLENQLREANAKVGTLQADLDEATHPDEANELKGKLAQLERHVEEVKVQKRDEVEAAKREVTESLSRKLEVQEKKAKELEEHKGKLERDIKVIVTEKDSTKNEVVQLRRDLLSKTRKVEELEKEKMYYWELLDSFKKEVLVYWSQFTAFCSKQYNSKPVQEIVKPIEDAVGPVWKDVMDQTRPVRQQIATAVRDVHTTLGEYMCMFMKNFADFTKAQDAPPVILTCSNGLHKYCKQILIINELFFAYWMISFLWGLLFGRKKKAQGKKTKVTNSKKKQ